VCGICGFVDLGRATSADALHAIAGEMADTLAARGPDDRGTWVDPQTGVALGHRRLAVIDRTDAAHQPMVSTRGRYVLTFNGEIYNHRELAEDLRRRGHRFRGHGDTEVLLAVIEAWGLEAALHRLNGMFAFALWDRVEEVLALVRDRMGEKPLAWGRIGDTVVFASDLRALRPHPAFRAELDRDALALYFRHKYVPSPFTIWRGIEKVPPAGMVRIDRTGQVVRSCYWRAHDHLAAGPLTTGSGPPPDAPRQEEIDELESLLADAVGRRMVADVPLGAFLSGGLDSAVVVALMARQASVPVRTFTIGNTDPRFDESSDAEAVARHLGTDHTTLRVSAADALAVVPRLAEVYDEPFADSSQIPTLLVAELARREVTVSLSGDGGDEVFGGYNRYRWIPAIWDRVRPIPRPLRRWAASGLGAVPAPWWDQAIRVIPRRRRPRLAGTKVAKVSQVAGLDGPEAMYRRLTSHWPRPTELVLGAREHPTLVSSPTEWPAAPTLAEQLMAVDLVTYLPDDILVKLDRATMAVSLEGRAPLLDHRVVELGLARPLWWKHHHSVSKWALREVATRLVPPELLDRPKMGFGVPVGTWLRGPLRPWAEALLAPDRLRRHGVLAPEVVSATWEAHQRGRRDHSYELWDVVMFQAWWERWG
jgi:asparagine synthase (glutamine-hydrolysing)